MSRTSFAGFFFFLDNPTSNFQVMQNCFGVTTLYKVHRNQCKRVQGQEIVFRCALLTPPPP